MKFTEPQVEWWQQTSIVQHIARVGRICYKAKGKQPEEGMTEEEVKAFIQKRDEERCKGFWESGHRSMYRHGTCYFFLPNEKGFPNYIWAYLNASPYIDYATKNHKVWISTNMQFLLEHKNMMDALNPYNVSEEEFIEKAQKYACEEALSIIRMTMVVTTQISTSRELNRTSPNSIAEQSTRYCNLEKKGGVQIARPHWHVEGSRWQRMVYSLVCRVCEWGYNRLLKSGLKPQDARGILPLDTYTVVAYTYTLSEWSHILDLRYHEMTGMAHPNAKIIGEKIRNIIIERMRHYCAEFDI
ncbi:FAD-dependent thymidylate synthase [uncultured Prevotella sp.]|uniref:FAD-dependent thymidylate synthase n=1 Tax=uncultured Prevotella sp. TaxID=159272 RepID=UPI0025946138|nr:FAD-dependent thymidylate synthase [uncultured Prevotella sp.]